MKIILKSIAVFLTLTLIIEASYRVRDYTTNVINYAYEQALTNAHALARDWGYMHESEAPLPEPELNHKELAELNAIRHGLNPSLFRAVITVESGWKPYAISPKGALGLSQIMPFSAKRCNTEPENLLNPEINLYCGARILSQELETYKGDVVKALRAYNGGHKCVVNSCRESIEYVTKVMNIVATDI